MIQYTTPTITLIIEGVDIFDNDIYVSLEQREPKLVELTKTGGDLDVRTEVVGERTDTIIDCYLTQEETAGFDIRTKVAVQVNWIDGDGVRAATEMAFLRIAPNLLDKVL